MGVKKYRTRRGVLWEIDEWLTLPDGTKKRYRQRQIPTREQANAMINKVRAEAFEGRFFDKRREPSFTVKCPCPTASIRAPA